MQQLRTLLTSQEGAPVTASRLLDLSGIDTATSVPGISPFILIAKVFPVLY